MSTKSIQQSDITFLRTFKCTEGRFIAYEFETSEEVYVEEAGEEFGLFRLGVASGFCGFTTLR